jgi:hypothetical protein
MPIIPFSFNKFALFVGKKELKGETSISAQRYDHYS